MIEKHSLTKKIEQYTWQEIYDEQWGYNEPEEKKGYEVDGVIYDSLKEASEKTGFSYTTLKSWFNGSIYPKVKIKKHD